MPLIDHTHFVGTLYWHVSCTTSGSMAEAKKDVHTLEGEKKLVFMNYFWGEDCGLGGGEIPPCTPE